MEEIRTADDGGCEWDPTLGRVRFAHEPAHAAADVLLADPCFGTWTLCSGCHRLQRFERMRVVRAVAS